MDPEGPTTNGRDQSVLSDDETWLEETLATMRVLHRKEGWNFASIEEAYAARNPGQPLTRVAVEAYLWKETHKQPERDNSDCVPEDKALAAAMAKLFGHPGLSRPFREIPGSEYDPATNTIVTKNGCTVYF